MQQSHNQSSGAKAKGKIRRQKLGSRPPGQARVHNQEPESRFKTRDQEPDTRIEGQTKVYSQKPEPTVKTSGQELEKAGYQARRGIKVSLSIEKPVN